MKFFLFFLGFFLIAYISFATTSKISEILITIYLISWIIYDQIELRKVNTKLSNENNIYTKKDEIARQIIEKYHLTKEVPKDKFYTKLEDYKEKEYIETEFDIKLESLFNNIFTLIKDVLKIIIMIIIVIGSISLEVIWLGFLFGSVIGCVLMLIFFPEGFLLPLGLIALFKIMLYGE